MELIKNKLVITFPDGDEETIEESNIVAESMKIRYSVCDEAALRFGGCIATEFRIDLLSTSQRAFTQEDQLAGKWISVRLSQYQTSDSTLYPSQTLYPSKSIYPGKKTAVKHFYVFSGFISSAKVSQADKNVRNIVAYDVLAKMYEWDATAHLLAVWSAADNETTLGQLYDYCLAHNGHMRIPAMEMHSNMNARDAEQRALKDYKTFHNDWVKNPSKISYGALLRDLCEIVCTFGRIRPNAGKGTFEMIGLRDSEYNSPRRYAYHESLYAEEYTCTGYTAVEVPVYYSADRTVKTSVFQLDHRDGCSRNTPKTYDLSDNILACRYLGDGTAGYLIAVQKFYQSIVGDCLVMNENGAVITNYQPYRAKVEANLNMKVGDPVAFEVNKTAPDGSYILDENNNFIKETISSYVLTRTLTGIQALTDEIEAKGLM